MIQKRAAEDAEIRPFHMIVVLTIRIRAYPFIPFCYYIAGHNYLPFLRVFSQTVTTVLHVGANGRSPLQFLANEGAKGRLSWVKI